MRKRIIPSFALTVLAFTSLDVTPTPSIARATPTSSDASRHAEVERSNIWTPKTTSVSVFKNGYGFFTREGSVQLDDGWGHAASVPPAAFGTLAIYASDPTHSVDTVGVGDGELLKFYSSGSGADDPNAKLDSALAEKTLRTALGTKVVLHIHTSEQNLVSSIEGKLVRVVDGYVIVERPSENRAERSVAIPIDQISSMQRVQLPMRFHVNQDDGTPAPQTDLKLSYLRNGIVWIPEYTLRIIDDETAELTLRGTLVNEAEDLENCDVQFVVGVPNFVHSNLLTPIAVGQTIRGLGHALSSSNVPPQIMNQVMNRAAIVNNFSQTANSSVSAEGEQDSMTGFHELVGSIPPTSGASTGDFSIYTKENVTLRKGERATLFLMKQTIRYDHKYKWESNSSLKHWLKLVNDGTTPWTTGACLALSGNHPLSEDILQYTPGNGQGELLVTSAINIANDASEEETNRELKAHSPATNQFLDLVSIKGNLVLKSYESKPVTVDIVQKVQGKPVKSTHDGKSKIDSNALKLTERNGTFEWKIQLNPGEEKTISYEYQRYVPSN